MECQNYDKKIKLFEFNRWNMSNLNLLSANEILKILNDNNNILISGHQSPDGDCIGSQLGLYYYLRYLGKDVYMINCDPVPENLMFLKGCDELRVYNPDTHDTLFLDAGLIIITDVNETSRTGAQGDIILKSKAKKLVIDHHIDPDEFADYYYIDTEASSTGQLIWRIIDTDDKYNPGIETAEALYAAIMTDTGSFRFPRTNAEVHRSIASLIEIGVKPEDMYDNIYNTNSYSAFRLTGLAMSKLELHFNGLLGIISLKSEDFTSTGAEQADTENIVERILSVKGVKIGIFIREAPGSGFLRVSLRSKDVYSVRDIAAKFNGGGHFHAAGARLYGADIDSGIEMILKAASDMIKSVSHL